MSLKFFIDQCVPASIGQSLRDNGYEVLVLKEHIPIDSPDEIVIAKAQELDAILVSLNGDFSDIVMYPPDHYYLSTKYLNKSSITASAASGFPPRHVGRLTG